MTFLLSLAKAIQLSQSASSKVFQLLLPCISPEDNGKSWGEQVGDVCPMASCSHMAIFNVVSNWRGWLRKQRQHWGMSGEGASTPERLRPPLAAQQMHIPGLQHVCRGKYWLDSVFCAFWQQISLTGSLPGKGCNDTSYILKVSFVGIVTFMEKSIAFWKCF